MAEVGEAAGEDGGLVAEALEGGEEALGPLGLGLVASAHAAARPFPFAPLTVIAVAAFALALAGELCERYLFFAAAPASKMPGGIN